MTEDVFSGFSEATSAFLAGLSAHNEKSWFEDHRAEYDAHYVGAAKTFVMEIGPRLQAISPDVQFSPRINGSISRINRDVRFSKDKRPYKDHLDIWFWHGEKRGWDCPGFYLRLTAETVLLGTGMHFFPKDMLKRFRDVVGNPAKARELKSVIDAIAASGPYEIGGKTRKSVPRGIKAEGLSAELLLYEALFTGLEWDNSVTQDAGFIDFCLGHWQKCWPIGQWIHDNVWR